MVRRRGNNEGTLFQRVDGRWEARVSLPSGKRKSFYGKTRREVEKLMREALNELEKGILPADGRQTVEQFITFWLQSVKNEIEPSSYRRYKFHLLRIRREFGNLPLSKLTAQRLQAFYSQLLAEGLSQTTVNVLHRVFKHALSDAVRLSIIPRNIAELVKPPRYEPKPKQVFTEAQARQFLRSVRGDRFEALYVLALTTGMREGELFALQWEDIDFERQILSVRRGMQQTEEGYKMAAPKSKKSRRTIMLPSVALQALHEHRQRQQVEKDALGEVWNKTHDFVFPDRFGRHKVPNYFISDEFPRHLERAGVPVIHFHDLRHTAATLLLSRGVNVKVVSEMLGHADISITLRIYGHVLPNMQEMAAKVADEIFSDQDET